MFGVNHLLNVIHSVKSVDKLSHLIDGCRKSDKYLSNILIKVMIDRYPINITYRHSKKSIQSDKYWPSYSVGQVWLTERTNIQTDKQTTTLILIYNKKNIHILPQTRLLIYTDEFNLHTLHTHKHTIQGRPPSPPVDNIHTHNTYAQTHKHASAFSTSAFFERGKAISEGGSSRPIRRRHFPMYCY